MARYRKIDPRIWGDERFATFSATQKLAWIGLLTHPVMTPMGAGIFPSSLLDSLIGYDTTCGGITVCPVCLEETDVRGSSDAILEGFKEASLILRDNDLVIVKNFLVYNRPDNPNQLSGWIEWCEELPRSSIFAALEAYLHDTLEGHPPWLFAGLLKPLSEQRNKTLKARYWDRISEYVDRPQGRIKKGTKEGIKEPSKVVRTNQEQELEQELEKEKEQDKESSKDKYSIETDSVIDYLNEKASSSFRHSAASRKNIGGRLTESFTSDDCKLVIDFKCSEWTGTDFDKYLTPETLFRPSKFENNLNAAKKWDASGRKKPSSNGNGTNRALTRGAEEFADVFEES